MADCLSAMRGNIRASCSAPPFWTISSALSLVYQFVPTSTTTTLTPPRSAMLTPLPSRSAICSGVGTCLFGGTATVLLGLIGMPMLDSSRWRQGTTSTVSGMISIIPMLVSSRQAIPPHFLARTSPLQHRLDRHAEQCRPMASLCYAPLEQSIFRLSPDSI